MTASSLFSDIELILPPLDGWCTVQRASEFASIVVGQRAKTSVVIGVWGGRDTFALALAHRFIGQGKVVAIDPWQAQASVVGQTGKDAEWWANQQMHDEVYARFIANLGAFDLGDWIDVQKKKASEVEPPKEISLLIVDGNHGPDSIADVERFAPNVVPGGVVYMDDVNWTGGSVQVAVEKLKALGFIRLYDRDTGAFFQRIAVPVTTSSCARPAPKPARSGRVREVKNTGRARK